MTTLTTAPMTLHFCPWPEGTEVGAYLRISETMVFESTPPGQVPVEEVFVAEGQVTFSSLPVGDYWAVGQMPDGKFRYVSFRQQPDPPGMMGPPGPPGGTMGAAQLGATLDVAAWVSNTLQKASFTGYESDGDPAALVIGGPGQTEITVRDAGTYLITAAVVGGQGSARVISQIWIDEVPWDVCDTGQVTPTAQASPTAQNALTTVIGAGQKLTLRVVTDSSGSPSGNFTVTRQGGPPGPPGPQGIQGPAGALPVGGDSKTWLRKNTPADFDASWYASGAVTLGLGQPSNGFGLDGDVQVDTSVGRIFYKQSGVWTSLPFYTQVTSTLPASPFQGQEVYLRVGSFVGNPDYVIWHLRWETNYPVDRWEFLGGMPIRVDHTSGGDLVAASTNTQLIIDNTWLEVNLPYNGIYEVDYVARDFGVTSGLSVATVEIQRMVAAATYTAAVGRAEQNAQGEYTANAAGTYLPFHLHTIFDLRDKSATYRQPPVICPTLQRTSGGTWSLRGKRHILVRPIYLIP